jgi:ABC-type uncharacterized transport system involved in gliding motility auxiliary subunit
LDQAVDVIVFYQPSHKLYEPVRSLLTEYERKGGKLTIEFVDPEQDLARAKQLAKELEIDQLNVVVVRSGPRHKHLTDAELAEFDLADLQTRGEPGLKAFKGEEAFTAAILNVTEASVPLVWFTSGHGEKDLAAEEPMGLSQLSAWLTQQNMSAQAVTLLEQKEIPPEVRLLVIAGPMRRFAEHELALLDGFLARGGKLLVLLDPLDDSGLEELLRRFGILVQQDIVVDPSRQLPFVSAANVLITTYTQHPIVQRMQTFVTLFPLARSVRAAEPAPEGVTVAALAMTSDAGWGETQTGADTFEFHEGADLKGPVPIAAAAERPQAGGAGAPARLVVIGDSDFAVNAQLSNVGNRDFLAGAVYWLLEQEQRIGIGPKTLESIRLSLSAAELTRVFWFGFLGLPLLCGLMGASMWWVRRQ